jgi:hypothetical protein
MRCAVVLTRAADLAGSWLQSMKASLLVLVGTMWFIINLNSNGNEMFPLLMVSFGS